jgi:hypothetical protein
MFASLNRFISRLDAEPTDKSGLGRGAAGFQCLRNKNSEIPIEPWFDFIVGINGRQIVCLNWRIPKDNADRSRITQTQISLQQKFVIAQVVQLH